MSETVKLFDVVNNLSSKKDGHLLVEDEYNKVDYSPYMINKALSYKQGAVLFVNEMNRYYGLSKQQQYDFYFYGMPKLKFGGKWHKQEKNDSIQLVMDVYKYSRNRALEVLDLLEDSMEIIKQSQEKGGRK